MIKLKSIPRKSLNNCNIEVNKEKLYSIAIIPKDTKESEFVFTDITQRSVERDIIKFCEYDPKLYTKLWNTLEDKNNLEIQKNGIVFNISLQDYNNMKAEKNEFSHLILVTKACNKKDVSPESLLELTHEIQNNYKIPIFKINDNEVLIGKIWDSVNEEYSKVRLSIIKNNKGEKSWNFKHE